MKQLKVGELDDSHLGHRVHFPRPVSEHAGRRRITGKLISAVTAGPAGSIEITVDYNGKGNIETFGPLPARFPIGVGAKWIDRREPEPDYRYFPRDIETIRALLLGGPFDGQRKEFDADYFEFTAGIYEVHPEDANITLVYEPLTPIFRRDGGLAVGKWGLVRSYDRSKSPDAFETTYKWQRLPDAGLLSERGDTPIP